MLGGEWVIDDVEPVAMIPSANASGYSDEEQLVQPRVFPLFAEEFLDFEVGVTLAAEIVDRAGRPDFTPADAVTHPFVFETKSTNLRAQLRGCDHQVLRYLQGSSRRINASSSRTWWGSEYSN
jgi:hypothetical protein